MFEWPSGPHDTDLTINPENPSPATHTLQFGAVEKVEKSEWKKKRNDSEIVGRPFIILRQDVSVFVDVGDSPVSLLSSSSTTTTTSTSVASWNRRINQ